MLKDRCSVPSQCLSGRVIGTDQDLLRVLGGEVLWMHQRNAGNGRLGIQGQKDFYHGQNSHEIYWEKYLLQSKLIFKYKLVRSIQSYQLFSSLFIHKKTKQTNISLPQLVRYFLSNEIHVPHVNYSNVNDEGQASNIFFVIKMEGYLLYKHFILNLRLYHMHRDQSMSIQCIIIRTDWTPSLFHALLIKTPILRNHWNKRIKI